MLEIDWLLEKVPVNLLSASQQQKLLALQTTVRGMIRASAISALQDRKFADADPETASEILLALRSFQDPC